MKFVLPLLLSFFFSSCSTFQCPLGFLFENGKKSIEVSVSSNTMVLRSNGAKVKKIPIERSPLGVGSTLGSHKTPVGKWNLSKEPDHRYGPVLRLSGFQGKVRGILIHQDLTHGRGTNGCIAVPDLETMKEIFRWVDEDTELVIRS